MKKSPGIRQVLALCALTALTITAGAARAAEPVKVRLGDLAQALNSIASNVMIQQGFEVKHDLAIHAYEWMTNHIHLLATPGANDSISKVFQSGGK